MGPSGSCASMRPRQLKALFRIEPGDVTPARIGSADIGFARFEITGHRRPLGIGKVVSR